MPSHIRRTKSCGMKISGIDHVVVNVSDMDRAIHFYCDLIGCALEWRRDDIGLAHLRVGTSFVDLKAGQSMPLAQGRNMDHLCLAVVDFDLDSVRAELTAHNVRLGEAGHRFGASGWGPSLYIFDPDDNVLELRA